MKERKKTVLGTGKRIAGKVVSMLHKVPRHEDVLEE
jgi:uncharacterized membrane protein YqjE